MNHIIDSVTAQEFFLQRGIVISGNSTLDNVSLYDMKTGETLQLVTKKPVWCSLWCSRNLCRC